MFISSGTWIKKKIDHCYNISDIVCFPSRLETWGLPLSEAKERGKWVLASDFPFTRETLGSYEKKAFLILITMTC